MKVFCRRWSNAQPKQPFSIQPLLTPNLSRAGRGSRLPPFFLPLPSRERFGVGAGYFLNSFGKGKWMFSLTRTCSVMVLNPRAFK